MMEWLLGIHNRISVALDHMPQVRSALKVVLVLLIFLVVSLPILVPDNPWSWAGFALMLLLNLPMWSGGPDMDKRPPQR